MLIKETYIKLLIEDKLIICALGNLHYQISREKFKPEPGFEPRTTEFLARGSTTWAILVFMPAYVQISLLRRMPLLPGGSGHDTICHYIEH